MQHKARDWHRLEHAVNKRIEITENGICVEDAVPDLDQFQANSCAELILVQAAHNQGYLLIDCAAQSSKLQFHGFDRALVVEMYGVLDGRH